MDARPEAVTSASLGGAATSAGTGGGLGVATKEYSVTSNTSIPAGLREIGIVPRADDALTRSGDRTSPTRGARELATVLRHHAKREGAGAACPHRPGMPRYASFSGIHRRRVSPGVMSWSPSVHPAITWFRPKVMFCPRATEESNICGGAKRAGWLVRGEGEVPRVGGTLAQREGKPPAAGRAAARGRRRALPSVVQPVSVGREGGDQRGKQASE